VARKTGPADDSPVAGTALVRPFYSRKAGKERTLWSRENKTESGEHRLWKNIS